MIHQQSSPHHHPLDEAHPRPSVALVFGLFLRLGLVAFGGPVAHLSHYRAEFVEKRRWLSEGAYARILAFCQMLPGPASSQTGMMLGLRLAGWRGMLAAWVGFTLPSATAMTLAAVALGSPLFRSGALHGALRPALHGLALAACAVVAEAVRQMAKNLCPNWPRRLLALVCGALTLALAGLPGQLAAIGLGAGLGLALGQSGGPTPPMAVPRRHMLRAALGLGVFFALLFGLPALAALAHHFDPAAAARPLDLFARITREPDLFARITRELDVFARITRAGSMVFGGGHVVMPVLSAALVGPGYVSPQSFMAGYGLVQAMPGPLFTFAAFLGATASAHGLGGAIAGGALATLAIFLPSFPLVLGLGPLLNALPEEGHWRAALSGINAAVVGLLAAALYRPVAITAISSWPDALIAAVAFLALNDGLGRVSLRLPPWALVGLMAVGGALAVLL